jgi:hypothetical protein
MAIVYKKYAFPERPGAGLLRHREWVGSAKEPIELDLIY